MQLPSNKISGLFILVVLIVVLVIGGNVFYDRIRPMENAEIVDGNLFLQRKTTDKTSADRDNDGLMDWQEQFYGSNADVFDTDGDGTGDGDEINEGRDPTIAGPNDALSSMSDLLDSNFDSENYLPGSLTDNLSIDLFSNYLNLKNTNNLTTETATALTDNLANQVESQSKLEPKYFKENINQVDSTDENLQKYGNDFAIIYLDYMKQISQVDDSNDDLYILKIADLYESFANVLISINVPSVAVNVHLEIVNKLYNTGFLFKELSDYKKDPLKSLLAIRKAKENSAGETELYISLANYFKDNGIIFEDNDVIRFWNLFE